MTTYVNLSDRLSYKYMDKIQKRKKLRQHVELLAVGAIWAILCLGSTWAMSPIFRNVVTSPVAGAAEISEVFSAQ